MRLILLFLFLSVPSLAFSAESGSKKSVFSSCHESKAVEKNIRDKSRRSQICKCVANSFNSQLREAKDLSRDQKVKMRELAMNYYQNTPDKEIKEDPYEVINNLIDYSEKCLKNED